MRVTSRSLAGLSTQKSKAGHLRYGGILQRSLSKHMEGIFPPHASSTDYSNKVSDLEKRTAYRTQPTVQEMNDSFRRKKVRSLPGKPTCNVRSYNVQHHKATWATTTYMGRLKTFQTRSVPNPSAEGPLRKRVHSVVWHQRPSSLARGGLGSGRSVRGGTRLARAGAGPRGQVRMP